MTDETQATPLSIGFFTTIELAEKEIVGGLLVTDRYGKPLEFQCTSPVSANKTQAILFGPTLKSYLIAELIGQSLFQKVSVKPNLLVTDQEIALEVRQFVRIPVLTVEEVAKTQGAITTQTTSTWRGRTLRYHSEHRSDANRFEEISQKLPEHADLCEPFERVREALREANRFTQTSQNSFSGS